MNRFHRAALVAVLSSVVLSPIAYGQQPPFEVEEASVADVQSALRSGAITCRGLVQRYLDRIAAYDKNGPGLNAIVLVNPDVLTVADSLDRAFRSTGRFVGPLHCVPTIVKDNFATVG